MRKTILTISFVAFAVLADSYTPDSLCATETPARYLWTDLKVEFGL